MCIATNVRGALLHSFLLTYVFLLNLSTFLLSSHTHTAIDGVTFKLKDETDTQQYLMQVSTTMHTAIMGNGWLHSCSIVQFALGQLKLLSLEDVESEVSSLRPPSLPLLSHLSHSSLSFFCNPPPPFFYFLSNISLIL